MCAQYSTQGRWDAVVDFLAYTPAQVDRALEAFGGRAGQYLFNGTAAAYDKVNGRLPIVEDNRRAQRERGLPVVCHGDGAALWVMTHASDFAVGLTGVLGHSGALGEAFHITSDEVLTWDAIYETIARAAGAEPRLVPGFQPKMSFAEGIAQSIAQFDADPSRRTVSAAANDNIERVLAAWGRADVERIHEASLRILQEAGVRLESTGRGSSRTCRRMTGRRRHPPWRRLRLSAGPPEAG